MEKLFQWLKRNWLKLAVFAVILAALLWRLGTYPNYFDFCVEHAVHFEVDKVLDNADISKDVTWQWRDMHQLEGGRSPIYGPVIELGLRLFGLTLFGIRLFPALIAFLVLIFVYITMRKFLPEFLTLTFIILLATSPWFLVVSRSGGIVGFSLSMVLVSLCLVALAFLNKSKAKMRAVLPILAGLSVGILPYGYAITRLIPLFVIFWLTINIRKINKLHYVLFLVSVLAVVSLQFGNIKDNTHMYFNARGESMFEAAKDGNGTIQLDYVKKKMTDNIIMQSKMLLGFNLPERFWDPTIADSFWRPTVVVYPRFLVPFFVIGFLLSLVHIFVKRTLASTLPILYFIVTLGPGLMAGRGTPDMGRNFLAIVPLYFFIAYTINHYYEMFKPRLGQVKGVALEEAAATARRRLPSVVFVLFVAIVVFTAGFQTANFFFRDRGGDEDRITGGHVAHRYLQDYLTRMPTGRVLICENPILDEYSYVIDRWLGGKPLEEKLKSGQVKLLRHDNEEEIKNLIASGYFDAIISSDIKESLEEKLPALKEFKAEDYEKIARVYYPKQPSAKP